MVASARRRRTGGRGDCKKTPEEIAEERIEAARNAKATALDLSRLGMGELPVVIGQLTQLERLNISHNQLTSLPEEIGQLFQLRSLDVERNQLSLLPEAIGQLTQLETLRAPGNRLTSLPQGIQQLARLRYLNLSANQLSILPESLGHLVNLERLFLHDNVALGLPLDLLGHTWVEVDIEHVVPANPAIILDYYFKMRAGRRPLNEVRLLLVGRGAAGKTSIVRRLIEDRFVEGEPETMGIDILPWELKCGADTIRAHVWDFAGQVITHATHQFFLSHRSMYVLVLTGREDSEKQDAEYWLRLIRAFGTDAGTGQTSPVIVALNKCDLAACSVDRNALQEKYPFIVGFVETDCRSGRGVTDLKHLILETADGMASVRESFPRAWFAIKESLATMKADYVSYGEFRAQCRQFGESDAAAQDSLARVLHRLGVALNYADDERLREATVLNPHWVTNGIYRLLRQAVNERGIMTIMDVARVLPQEKPEMRRYLVELLRRFDLAFQLTEASDEWLVPQRLPATQPKLGREWQESALTRLRYTYTALPEGLIPRFITHTYPLSDGQARWVNGVVLRMNDAWALVRSDPAERCVTVAVGGSADGRRRLAGLVREDLRRIHADIRGLEPLEEMELEGQPGEWVRVQTLEADERKKQPSAAATRDGTVSVDNTSELNRVSAPAARDPAQRKARLFIVYSSRDARQRDELAVRLSPLRSEGLVEAWSDRCLVAGQKWDERIRRESEEAHVVLILLSPDLLASEYLDGSELNASLDRHLKGDMQVIPVVLRECGWEATALGQLPGLPTGGRALVSWENRDDAWYNVASAVTQALAEQTSRMSPPKPVRKPLPMGEASLAAGATFRGNVVSRNCLSTKQRRPKRGGSAAEGSSIAHKVHSRPFTTGLRESRQIKPISVAVSYSHKDDKLRRDLVSQLTPLKRLGFFRTWHDRMISAGTDWKAEIDDVFKQADLILLLVSSDFIASDYCYEVELKTALKREAEGEARVVPIILRACLWQWTPLGKLQALPRSAKPITSFSNRDHAWTDVVMGIEGVVKELSAV